MSELRYNILTRDWVIIATERAKRPEAFKKEEKNAAPVPERKDDCPFCPGNEGDLKDETYRISDGSSWKTRSVYNKFPALSPAEKATRVNNGAYSKIGGFGIHEVIVEHPRHNAVIALMDDLEVEGLVNTYVNRYISLQKDKRIEAITLFKNHGKGAGSSQDHPHSQIVATPIVPPQIRSRVEQATRYFDTAGRCIFCHMLEHELRTGERIVLETNEFVSFMPYAASAPFLTWIFPRRHMNSFDEMTGKEIKDLAINLKTTLGKLYRGLNNPDFNFTVRSIPVRERGLEYFHWYLTIVPRINQPAGFELGSGIFINVSLPEEGAKFLREIK